MLESKFQAELIKKLERTFKGCTVLILDPNYIQGIPDLLILYKTRYALLEVKASENSKRQPNQEYYINKWKESTFSEFVYPENENEILEQLYNFFQ